MRLDSKSQIVDADARRELLAELRANGVEHELRDGREFVVLKLPSFASGVRALAPRVEPRVPRAVRLA